VQPGKRTACGPALRIGLYLLLLPVLAGAFIPGRWLWGANHLAYLPRWMTAAWVLLALLAVWPRSVRGITRLLSGPLPRFLFESRSAAILVPAVSGALFWILRSRSFFLGDGHLLAELTAKGVPFHGFDDMDYTLRATIFRVSGLSSLDSAFLVFQIVSVISGVLGIALSQHLLRRLPWPPWRRAFAFLLVFSGGAVCLYFGYVEVYSLLFAFLTAFLLSGLLALTGRISPWVCSLFFALALASHLTAIFSLPALVYLTVRLPRRPWAKRVLDLWLLPAIPLALWIVVHLLTGWDQGWLRRGFLESEHERMVLLPLTGKDGLLSLHHWKDLVNLALILSAIPLWGVLSQWHRIARGRLDPGGRFLLVQALAIGILVIVIDRKLGAARDWDLLAAHAGGLALLAAAVWVPEQEEAAGQDGMEPAAHAPGGGMGRGFAVKAAPASAALAAVFSILLLSPWIVLQHMETRSALRLASVAGDFDDFARPYTFEELGMHFRLKGDLPRAEQMYKACVEAGPDNPRFHINLGATYGQEGKTDLARREYLLARQQLEGALQARPGDPATMRRLAQVLAWQGEPRRAAELYAELTREAPGDESLWEALGECALQAADPEQAAPALRRALELGGDRGLRCDLGLALLDAGRFSEAADAFRPLVSDRELELPARFGLAAALISSAGAERNAGRDPDRQSLDEAEEQLRRLLAVEPGDPDAQELLRKLQALMVAGTVPSGR
jgi:tetratricopeptide (TPR) repeat protein